MMKKIQVMEVLTLIMAVGMAGCLLWMPLSDNGCVMRAVTGLLVVSIIVFAVIGLVVSIRQKQIMEFLIRDNQKQKKTDVRWGEEEAQGLELLRKRVDLSMLQMQINPHFLYNTLDTIRSQALVDGNQDIAVMTEKLSRFFRYCISTRENMVKLAEETEHILDYYYIQKKRFGDRFEMELKIENEELCEYYVPKQILQPLVENAIAHGLEKVKRRGMITIEICSTERKMVLKVSDNGIGMSETELERLNERLRLHQVVASRKGRSNGIAIMNVNSRIQLVFGEEYGIHYRSVEQAGTEAIVTLPKVDEFVRVRYEDILMVEE